MNDRAMDNCLTIILNLTAMRHTGTEQGLLKSQTLSVNNTGVPVLSHLGLRLYDQGIGFGTCKQ
jgi:hypothetical protein